jgi:hypothetical protein
MDPLDQKLDYKMSGLATATKKRRWTIPAWFSWFVNDGRWPSRWACSPTTCALSNAIHGCTKKNWVVWLAGHENTSATLSCPRSSRLKEKTVLHQEVCNTSKKNTITIPILPSCNHQISPLMGTAHPLPTSRRWQDQAQRRLGSCRLQVVDVACRLGLLQSMLGLSQGPQDAE